MTREVTTHRCPRCGSTLITNGKAEWCTFVGCSTGPVKQRPCTYGIDKPVPLRTIPALVTPDERPALET